MSGACGDAAVRCACARSRRLIVGCCACRCWGCDRYPSRETLRTLAARCNETPRRVNVFFVNRRAKDASLTHTTTTKNVKYFSPTTRAYLLARYAECPKPTTAQLRAIAAAVHEEFTRVRQCGHAGVGAAAAAPFPWRDS